MSVKVRARVLVVDSEPLVRWALTVTLSAAGYDVVTAADAVEAGAMVAVEPRPAVVLIDLRAQDLQDDRSFAALKRLAPQCRFLVLTTERRGGAPPAWLGAEVIEKPFDLALVLRMVAAAAQGTAHSGAKQD